MHNYNQQPMPDMLYLHSVNPTFNYNCFPFNRMKATFFPQLSASELGQSTPSKIRNSEVTPSVSPWVSVNAYLGEILVFVTCAQPGGVNHTHIVDPS